MVLLAGLSYNHMHKCDTLPYTLAATNLYDIGGEICGGRGEGGRGGGLKGGIDGQRGPLIFNCVYFSIEGTSRLLYVRRHQNISNLPGVASMHSP